MREIGYFLIGLVLTFMLIASSPEIVFVHKQNDGRMYISFNDQVYWLKKDLEKEKK